MAWVFERPLYVCGLYVALTLVMTWPLATGLTRDIPTDLGDPAFVAGVLTWGSKRWIDLLTGDLSAAVRFWNAPWFYPEPLTLAFSEHFALHSLLTLPVYVVTGNIILCYNLHVFAAFALSGLGMYLLVRELTGRPLAAFVAGLAYAFAPYRIAQLGHLQVVSSQWMPFALFYLHRYFKTAGEQPRVRPLAGFTLALWAQHLSSGYYMVFFGPFVAVFVLAEMFTTGLWRRLKVWAHILIAGAAAIALTMPFAMPYLIVKEKYHLSRKLIELRGFAADLLGWATAFPSMKVWGRLQTFVKDEGFLFPGFTVVVLALVGLWICWRGSGPALSERSESKGPAGLQARRAMAIFGVLTIVLSFWMSLGPLVEIRTQPTGFPAIYPLAWAYLPGYDVARVPARFAMITVLALVTVAGIALAAIDERRRWLVAICGALLLAEGFAAPLPMNQSWTSAPKEFVPADNRLYPEASAPQVYRFLRTLDNAVIAHLPFGLPEREIQYVYYAPMHGRRTVNGYSGAFPPSYAQRLADMQNVVTNPRATAERLMVDGVTHLVIHADAWTGTTGQELVALFDQSKGFERVAHFEQDYVYRLK